MTARNERGQFTAAETTYLETGDESALVAEMDAAGAGTTAEPDAAAAEPLQPADAAPAATPDAGAAATEPAAGAEAAPTKDSPGKVPLDALHRERAEKKELQAALAETKERMAVYEDRMRLMLETMAKAAKPKEEAPADDDPEPDPNEDIFAHNAWLRRQLDRRVAPLEQQIQQTEKQRQEAAEYAAAEKMVWDRWQADRAAYAQEKSDFDNAAQWLSDVRHKELEFHSRFNPAFRTPEARNRQINADLRDIVIAAAQAGVSSAEYIYQLALQRGYAPGATPAVTEAAAASPPASPTAAPPISPAAAEKLAAMKDVNEAARSLSGVPGGSGVDPMTLEGLSKLPQKEFNKRMAEMTEDDFRRMAGG